MPLVGFICPYRGESTKVPFDFCLKECNTPCMSMPLLLALTRDRDIVEGRYSVTEILNPPRIVYFKRHFDYYIHPFNLIWAVLGTAVHSIMESQKDKLPPDRYAVEKSFEVDLGYAKITGTPDLQDYTIKNITDYKVIKAYKAKKLLEGDWEGDSYLWQLNFYKVLAFHDAESLMIEAIIKDWSGAIQEEMDIHPVERIPVPVLPVDKVEVKLQSLMHEHMKNEENNALIRDCIQDEVWFQTNPRSKKHLHPLRCEGYCEVNSVCPQYKQYLEATNDAEKSRAYPSR